ncbi:MAG TPA: hypothetical protein VGI63_08330, partial [Verrucomicrobiae bacterium]
MQVIKTRASQFTTVALRRFTRSTQATEGGLNFFFDFVLPGIFAANNLWFTHAPDHRGTAENGKRGCSNGWAAIATHVR